jgi:hypothetical protein
MDSKCSLQEVTEILVPLEFVAGSTVAGAVKQVHIGRRDTAGSAAINRNSAAR